MHRAQPPGVRRAGRQRDVHGVALGVRAAHVLGEPGAREEHPAALVHRDREHAGVVPEDALDAVAVVDVDVHVGDPLGALVEQPADRDGCVVVDAEATRPVGHRVVQAAAEVHAVLDLAAPDRRGEVGAALHDAGAGLVHPDERRVVLGAEAAVEVGGRRVGRGRLHRRHVGRVVHGLEQRVVRRLGADDLDSARVVEQSERAGQPGGEVEAQRRHGVRRAEVVPREAVVPDHASLRRHGPDATPAGSLGAPGDAQSRTNGHDGSGSARRPTRPPHAARGRRR